MQIKLRKNKMRAIQLLYCHPGESRDRVTLINQIPAFAGMTPVFWLDCRIARLRRCSDKSVSHGENRAFLFHFKAFTRNPVLDTGPIKPFRKNPIGPGSSQNFVSQKFCLSGVSDGDGALPSAMEGSFTATP